MEYHFRYRASKGKSAHIIIVTLVLPLCAQIFKKDIGTHQVLKIKVSNLPDYPPKIIIHVKATGKVSSRPPRLQIIGLDKECSFVLPIPSKLDF